MVDRVRKGTFPIGKGLRPPCRNYQCWATARPHIRKQLTGAWDLAFAWLADEPGQHHALPSNADDQLNVGVATRSSYHWDDMVRDHAYRRGATC